MIVHGQGTSSDAGHVAIVNYISSDGVHVVEQNYDGTAHQAVYGFSNGTLSRKLYDSSGYLMPILGVVHSPNNTLSPLLSSATPVGNHSFGRTRVLM